MVYSKLNMVSALTKVHYQENGWLKHLGVFSIFQYDIGMIFPFVVHNRLLLQFVLKLGLGNSSIMYSTQCIWTAHTDTEPVQSWWSVHILHRRAFYLDSVLNCTMTLLWAISGWVPRHMIGAVLVSLPAVAVFSHITCDMHDSIQVNTRAKTLWRCFRLSFCVCVCERS